MKFVLTVLLSVFTLSFGHADSYEESYSDTSESYSESYADTSETYSYISEQPSPTPPPPPPSYVPGNCRVVLRSVGLPITEVLPSLSSPELVRVAYYLKMFEGVVSTWGANLSSCTVASPVTPGYDVCEPRCLTAFKIMAANKLGELPNEVDKLGSPITVGLLCDFPGQDLPGPTGSCGGCTRQVGGVVSCTRWEQGIP